MGLPRAATETEAANLALQRIGQAPVAALTEQVKRARAAARAFGSVRDALIRRHPWNFAKQRVALTAMSPAPSDGPFARRFLLADTHLVVWGVEGLGEDEWEVAGDAPTGAASPPLAGPRWLYCDLEAPLAIIGVVRDPAFWDPIFLDVFADKLAAELAPALAASPSAGDEFEQRAEAKLMRAVRADSREAAPSRRPQTTSWIAARGGRGWS